MKNVLLQFLKILKQLTEFSLFSILSAFPEKRSSPGLFFPSHQANKLLSWSSSLHNTPKKSLDHSPVDNKNKMNQCNGLSLQSPNDSNSASANRKQNSLSLGLVCVVCGDTSSGKHYGNLIIFI